MYYCLEYIPTHGFAYMDFFFLAIFGYCQRARMGNKRKVYLQLLPLCEKIQASSNMKVPYLNIYY